MTLCSCVESAKLWKNKNLRGILNGLGFTANSNKRCISNKTGTFWDYVYVHDLLIYSKCSTGIESLISQLRAITDICTSTKGTWTHTLDSRLNFVLTDIRKRLTWRAKRLISSIAWGRASCYVSCDGKALRR